ncbi:MAG: hypothetical protein IPJ51_12590 [Saprospiraceae bacterium]|nr:hypothetical protein [Saprospiraceae bacterium]
MRDLFYLYRRCENILKINWFCPAKWMGERETYSCTILLFDMWNGTIY